jgi:hypothetical protein
MAAIAVLGSACPSFSAPADANMDTENLAATKLFGGVLKNEKTRLQRPAFSGQLHDSVEVQQIQSLTGGSNLNDQEPFEAGLVNTGDFTLATRKPVLAPLGTGAAETPSVRLKPMAGKTHCLPCIEQLSAFSELVYAQMAGRRVPNFVPFREDSLDPNGYQVRFPAATDTSWRLGRQYVQQNVSGQLTAAQTAASLKEFQLPASATQELWPASPAMTQPFSFPEQHLAGFPPAHALMPTLTPKPQYVDETVVWNAWYKRVADAVYSVWSTRSKKGSGSVQLRITVGKNRTIDALVSAPTAASTAFKQSVIEAVRSFANSSTIEFPAQSQRKRVSFYATFSTGLRNEPGVRSSVNDAELVRSRR